MAKAIEVITQDALIDVGNGEVTATVGAIPELHRDNGQPSQAGDVLSVQPDGTLQTRPRGTDGSFERAKVTAAGLVYRPVGVRAFLVPFTTNWPNQ